MDALERARLATQADRILARLTDGPATNAELAALSLKYTSRISDLRARGHVIECYAHDHESGRCVYRLLGSAPRVRTEAVPAVVVPVPKGRLF